MCKDINKIMEENFPKPPTDEEILAGGKAYAANYRKQQADKLKSIDTTMDKILRAIHALDYTPTFYGIVNLSDGSWGPDMEFYRNLKGKHEYLELCLIRKWLLEVHYYLIEINEEDDGNYEISISNSFKGVTPACDNIYMGYDDALKVAIEVIVERGELT